MISQKEKEEIIFELDKAFPALRKNGYANKVYECVTNYYLNENSSRSQILDFCNELVRKTHFCFFTND